ncbi:MAG: MBL fold metallo-hydrolase [Chloroflexi bacterium]|nr:MAG: MBL fold metallo-hydrolase [Chloroflexota bacterium]
MEITWLGHSCFRMRGREGIVVTDPFSKEAGYDWSRPRADIVTISHPHDNHNQPQRVAGDPKVISGPGEYEISNIFVTGIGSYHDNKKGSDRGANTIYLIEFEDLKVCHLGDLGHVPSEAQAEALSGLDVLLVPVGGVTTINAAQAAEVVSLLEPRIVIPMHYKTKAFAGKLEGVEKFFKEMGLKDVEEQDSLKLNKSASEEETHVVVLKY